MSKIAGGAWEMLLENSETVHIPDVSVADTWDRLKADKRAVLVDVRTNAEWAFVGIPDLSALGKRIVAVEWQTFPDSRVAPDFAEQLKAALGSAGASKDDEVFFICRSGGRSRMAAEVMSEHGYRRCRNVADGFEGPLDADRHRGRVGGWKAAGLAWVQG